MNFFTSLPFMIQIPIKWHNLNLQKKILSSYICIIKCTKEYWEFRISFQKARFLTPRPYGHEDSLTCRNSKSNQTIIQKPCKDSFNIGPQFSLKKLTIHIKHVNTLKFKKKSDLHLTALPSTTWYRDNLHMLQKTEQKYKYFTFYHLVNDRSCFIGVLPLTAPLVMYMFMNGVRMSGSDKLNKLSIVT